MFPLLYYYGYDLFIHVHLNSVVNGKEREEGVGIDVWSDHLPAKLMWENIYSLIIIVCLCVCKAKNGKAMALHFAHRFARLLFPVNI